MVKVSRYFLHPLRRPRPPRRPRGPPPLRCRSWSRRWWGISPRLWKTVSESPSRTPDSCKPTGNTSLEQPHWIDWATSTSTSAFVRHIKEYLVRTESVRGVLWKGFMRRIYRMGCFSLMKAVVSICRNKYKVSRNKYLLNYEKFSFNFLEAIKKCEPSNYNVKK